MQLLGQSDVGNNNGVQSTGRILGLGAEITTGVVLVFALNVALPGHAAVGNGHGVLGGGLGGGAACRGSSA